MQQRGAACLEAMEARKRIVAETLGLASTPSKEEQGWQEKEEVLAKADAGRENHRLFRMHKKIVPENPPSRRLRSLKPFSPRQRQSGHWSRRRMRQGRMVCSTAT